MIKKKNQQIIIIIIIIIIINISATVPRRLTLILITAIPQHHKIHISEPAAGLFIF